MSGVEGPSHGIRKYFFFIKEKVSSDWKDLAFHLGVGPEDIRNIDRKNQDDKSRCMDLLEEWLKRKGERATIEVLMEALSEIELKSIVDALKIKYPELAAQRQPDGADQAQTESIKAPEGLKALETTNDSVKLGWTKVSSTQADGYRLEQSFAFEENWVSAQGDRKLLPATITEFTVVGLTPYTEYHFCVRSAIDRRGKLVLSERSVPLYVVTKTQYQPYRPRNLKLTDRTHASLSLTWNEPSPADDVNPAYYKYVVEMCAHSKDKVLNTWTESCRTTQCQCPINVQVDGVYRFRVSAINTERDVHVTSLPEEMGDPVMPIHVKTKSEWLMEVLKTFWPFPATTQPRSQESGSIIFNISCHDMEGLRELWMNYKLGKVKKFFENLFARLARLSSMEADTDLEIRIDKEDFYSCRRHLLLTRPTSKGFRVVRLGEGPLRGTRLGLSEDYPVYCKPISHKTTCSQLDFLDPAIPVDQLGLDRTICADKLLALPPPSRPVHYSSLPGLDLAVVRDDQSHKHGPGGTSKLRAAVQTGIEKSRRLEVQFNAAKAQLETERQETEVVRKVVTKLTEEKEKAQKIILEQKIEIQQLQENSTNMQTARQQTKEMVLKLSKEVTRKTEQMEKAQKSLQEREIEIQQLQENNKSMAATIEELMDAKHAAKSESGGQVHGREGDQEKETYSGDSEPGKKKGSGKRSQSGPKEFTSQPKKTILHNEESAEDRKRFKADPDGAGPIASWSGDMDQEPQPSHSAATIMASEQGDSTSVKFKLSPRNKLYLKISQNLSQGQVKSMQVLLATDHHISKAKIANKTPQEIFKMLEADDKIGEGNLGLLKDLLVALKETRLAKEAEDLERDERREMRKRNASSDDDSPAARFYSDLSGMRGRSGTRDRETREFESATIMASEQGDSTSVKFKLSPRNKLYLKISQNLSQGQVKSMQVLLATDHHISKAKIANKTPQEIFKMLEADNKIGEGNLGLLKDLLVALKETRLAKEAEDLERDERRKMRKRNLPHGDDSSAGPDYRNLRGVRDRPSMRDQDTLLADVSWLHSKLGFKVEKLTSKSGETIIQGSSIPLILPNDMKYNTFTGCVEKIQDAQRTSLQIVPEALELLEGIEEPVSVISICGPCRSGKSYILSRLLGTSDAFELGHSMDPQTFGIWMGTKVLRGKDFTIVLLDTEGIDAPGASAVQDASILVLTILLSSRVIYNSLNVPCKGDLEKMQCFIQLAKGLTVKKGEKIQTSLFHEFFPDFLWLLRDASLKFRDKNGKNITPTKYLITEVLESDPDDFFKSTSDKVGRAILTFFPSVDCATLKRPSEKKEVINNIAQHTDSLNPEFNKGVEDLTERLLLKSRVKRGYDKVSTISGVALSIMATQYVEAVNDPNSIPALDNTWQNTIELMRGRAIEEVVKAYKHQMHSEIAAATNNGQVPLEESSETEIHLKSGARGRRKHKTRSPPSQPTLMDLHKKVLNDVTDIFLEKIGHFGISSGDQYSENKFVVEQMQKRLVQREECSVDYVAADGTTRKQEGFVVTGGELLHYIQQNRELSKSFCQDLFERLSDPIRKHAESPPADYDMKKLTRELTDARQQYEKQARGPEKWVVLQEMIKDSGKLKDSLKKVKGYQTEIMQAQQREQEAELRAKEVERELQEVRQQVQDIQQTQEENLRKLIQPYEEQIDKIKQEMEEQFKVERKIIEDLRKAEMKEQAKIAMDRLEKLKAETTKRIEQMEKELESKRRTLWPLPFVFTKDDDGEQCTLL